MSWWFRLLITRPDSTKGLSEMIRVPSWRSRNFWTSCWLVAGLKAKLFTSLSKDKLASLKPKSIVGLLQECSNLTRTSARLMASSIFVFSKKEVLSNVTLPMLIPHNLHLYQYVAISKISIGGYLARCFSSSACNWASLAGVGIISQPQLSHPYCRAACRTALPTPDPRSIKTEDGRSLVFINIRFNKGNSSSP